MRPVQQRRRAGPAKLNGKKQMTLLYFPFFFGFLLRAQLSKATPGISNF
jgi:hypothetical protein